MAIKTLYFRPDVKASGVNYLQLQDGGTAPASASSVTGWNTSTVTGHSRMAALVKRESTTFTTTAQPSGTPDNALGDAYIDPGVTGKYLAGTWALDIPVISDGTDGFQDGRARVRVWRRPAGSATFTEITGGVVIGSTVLNLTAQEQISTVSWSAPEFTLSNEDLLIQVSWEAIQAGGTSLATATLRLGSAAKITTTDFSTSSTAVDKSLVGMVGW